MKTLKTLKSAAALSVIALSFVSAPSFATVGLHVDAPLKIMTCTKNCDAPDQNGPSLDGFAGATDGHFGQAPSIMTCTKNCDLPDQNGPSLDGFVAAPLQPETIGARTVGKN